MNSGLEMHEASHGHLCSHLWDSDPLKLSPRALAACQDSENEVLFSVASVWEMQLKVQFGKLRLNLPLSELIDSQQRINKVEILPVKLEHALALDKLPNHHKDPFDRLLVAQAQVERAVLVSKDQIFLKYPVELIW